MWWAPLAAEAAKGFGQGMGSGGGPSSADTGGMFDFGSSFTVSTGAGDAGEAPDLATLMWIAAAVLGAALVWKLAKKS